MNPSPARATITSVTVDGSGIVDMNRTAFRNIVAPFGVRSNMPEPSRASMPLCSRAYRSERSSGAQPSALPELRRRHRASCEELAITVPPLARSPAVLTVAKTWPPAAIGLVTTEIPRCGVFGCKRSIHHVGIEVDHRVGAIQRNTRRKLDELGLLTLQSSPDRRRAACMIPVSGIVSPVYIAQADCAPHAHSRPY